MSMPTSDQRSFALACAVAAFAVAIPAAAQERAWTGRYRCAALDGTRIGAIDQEMSATVNGSSFRFERQLGSVPGARATAGVETGSGTIGPDGRVEAKSAVVTTGWRYEGRFTGTATATEIRLTGVQHWQMSGGAQGGDRRCGITLAQTP